MVSGEKQLLNQQIKRSVFLGGVLLLIATTTFLHSTTPFFSERDVHLEAPQNPLTPYAAEIVSHSPLSTLTTEQCREIWKARRVAEQHLNESALDQRLHYGKLSHQHALRLQLAAYSPIPSFMDQVVLRKIYAVWMQSRVLWHLLFSSSLYEPREHASFWEGLSEDSGRNYPPSGGGALISEQVIETQRVYEGQAVRVLYNYAPLKEMHFLVAPKSEHPARDFMELEEAQYVEVLTLTKKIADWAAERFGDEARLHFFDKKGVIAGQTQPLYHAHIIITTSAEEEWWGKVKMFFRMLLPARPLSVERLRERVTFYQNSLGNFLEQSK